MFMDSGRGDLTPGNMMRLQRGAHLNNIEGRVIKTGLAIVLFAVLIAAAPLRMVEPTPLQGINQVSAPDVFGRGSLQVISLIQGNLTGRITTNRVTLRMVGTKQKSEISGYLVQLAGPTIIDSPCRFCRGYPAGHIPFFMYMHDGEFQGWLFFRGQNLAFCGGVDSIPKKCLLK